MRRFIAIALVFIAAPACASEITLSEHRSDDTLLRIGRFAFEGGKTLNLTIGIGSSAFRRPAIRPTRSGRSATAAPTSNART
jgi:hypothetical protein